MTIPIIIPLASLIRVGLLGITGYISKIFRMTLMMNMIIMMVMRWWWRIGVKIAVVMVATTIINDI
jgi:hypothetical protein